MKSEDALHILATCKTESERQLELMRRIAKEMFEDNPNYLVGVNGSVARRECTSGSDVDLFFLFTGDVNFEDACHAQAAYRGCLIEKGLDMPALEGVFQNPLDIEELLATIGGDEDTNEFITRRMLFLLEGEWAFNRPLFDKTRMRLINRYVTEDLGDSKLCLFLLNDVIRYWRTICVDFEHKTAEADKPRAIRLIKLRFSRMLLYLGGVAAVSETKGLAVPEKRVALEKLFALPTIERMQSVFEGAMDGPLQHYGVFLSQLDDPNIRKQLKLMGDAGLTTQVYKDLCAQAHDFKEELLTMLLEKFGPEHDVVKALLL